MTEHENSETLSNEFLDFFMNKIITIRNDLAILPLFQPECFGSEETFKIKLLIKKMLKKTNMSMKTNSCELDTMPTKLLKELLPWVLEPFTLLFNASLASKIFKSTWKTAIVRPLLKKQNASLELKNYRNRFAQTH